MKLFNFLVWFTPFFLTTITFPTTINGRFNLLSVSGENVFVKLQINTNTGTDDLGGATIVFSFDATSLSFPSNPVRNVDYTFQNFCGGNYSMATVTKPTNDKIWVNIDLPLSNINNGTVVSGSSGWTDIVTINFRVINANNKANLTWNTASLFWGIYDANNSSVWQIGSFQNLVDFPLPVELTSFTARVINSDVRLEWKTSNEVNNYGFDVERSLTSVIEDWKKIGFVEGSGNSNSPKDYSFTDANVTGGSKFKYRLKQIDNDGKYEYSESVEVEIIPERFALYQNYPNPFNPNTKIRFTIPEDVRSEKQEITLQVYDLLGKVTATLINEERSTGIFEVEFNAKGLPSGIYFYRLQAGSFVETKKMVLMK